MKKYLRLLIILLPLTILSCKTIPEEKKITLPPMPEREKLPEVTSIKDMADIIVKQEALIQSWEAWGLNVQGIIEGENPQ